jgi:hypothetical protein
MIIPLYECLFGMLVLIVINDYRVVNSKLKHVFAIYTNNCYTFHIEMTRILADRVLVFEQTQTLSEGVKS